MSDQFGGVLPATIGAPAQARQAISAWLRQVCGVMVLCDTLEDLVCEENEAITNCVEHAYPAAAAPSQARRSEHGLVWLSGHIERSDGRQDAGRVEVSGEQSCGVGGDGSRKMADAVV